MYHDLMVQLTKSDPHCWGQSQDPSESMFYISFLCGIVVPKVQKWCKYVFNHCAGVRFFFWSCHIGVDFKISVKARHKLILRCNGITSLFKYLQWGTLWTAQEGGDGGWKLTLFYKTSWMLHAENGSLARFRGGLKMFGDM